MAHMLSGAMRNFVEKVTGISFEELRTRPIEEVQGRMEARLGHAFCYAREPEQAARGSVLLELGEIVTPEEIEAELAKV